MRRSSSVAANPVVWPILGLLVGCTVGPDYHPPEVATPPRYAGAGAPLAAGADLATWWRRFGDPVLDRLVDQATHDNLDLQTAASRIREARQQEIVAGASAWPTLQADDQASRMHISQNAIGGLGSLLGGSAGEGSAQRASAPSIGFPGA